MKILALDVSSKSTGWFITKKSCGIISPPPKESQENKLVYFRTEVYKLIEKYKPDVVVIEDTYFRTNTHTLKVLSRFAGVAMEAAGSHNIKVEFITATQARKYCCGTQTGSFKKEEVFNYFVNKYNLSDWNFNDHNDITDAAALNWGYREKKKAAKKKSKD
jgi:Holliday junction resolvasome RuvABC endonuclease subunit